MSILRPFFALAATSLITGLVPGTVLGQAAVPGESLGTVRFETSCSGAAQAPFDRAVALLHHMTYSGARAEFGAIASQDPTCAMAHWGIAMTLFQPLWPTRPSPDDLERGWREVSRAKEIGTESERERMFIAAAAAFFDPASGEYWERIGRWAEASRALYDAYPEDPEARAFFALSHLATAPASGDLSHQATAAALLEGILRENPTHPGAIHYTIHANDATGREHEALDVVRRYGDIAPRNPHALHMPTHIFVRLGDWHAVIDGNLAAAEAALENPAGDRGQWVWDEFPHATEYLVYAYLQTGDDGAAERAMTRLRLTPQLQPTFKTAFHLSSIPARYALERRDWEAAARLEPRPDPSLDWDRFPWPEGVTWFARGIGSARSGDLAGARAALERLGRLEEATREMGEDLFARQTEILRLGVAAWTAHLEGDRDEAVRTMQQAVTLEATTPKHPVTPAPTLPAQELLGDLLLELERPEAALKAYRASLAATPGRLNSLVGAARAAERTGDADGARSYYRALTEQAVADSPRPELREAAGFGSDRPGGGQR